MVVQVSEGESLMGKEYGKLTAEQFKEFIGKMPELRDHQGRMSRMLRELPGDKFKELMQEGFNWAEVYEFSFAEHIAICVIAFGQLPLLEEIGRAPDAQQAILESWGREVRDEDIPAAFEAGQLVGLAFSLQRTILSVMLFQRSLSGLVQDVRDNDNMDSMFNAIRVDRTVMSCTTFADKIARAELRQDKRFFLRLRNALKGPSLKHWAAYCDLRYSLFVLRELGFDSMSDAQLEKLLVHTLKVYPDTPAARKNLRAQYQRSKKLPIT
jgi:hypothetical protein